MHSCHFILGFFLVSGRRIQRCIYPLLAPVFNKGSFSHCSRGHCHGRKFTLQPGILSFLRLQSMNVPGQYFRLDFRLHTYISTHAQVIEGLVYSILEKQTVRLYSCDRYVSTEDARYSRIIKIGSKGVAIGSSQHAQRSHSPAHHP